MCKSIISDKTLGPKVKADVSKYKITKKGEYKACRYFSCSYLEVQKPNPLDQSSKENLCHLHPQLPLMRHLLGCRQQSKAHLCGKNVHVSKDVTYIGLIVNALFQGLSLISEMHEYINKWINQIYITGVASEYVHRIISIIWKRKWSKRTQPVNYQLEIITILRYFDISIQNETLSQAKEKNLYGQVRNLGKIPAISASEAAPSSTSGRSTWHSKPP